jgi:hypothetical protein
MIRAIKFILPTFVICLLSLQSCKKKEEPPKQSPDVYNPTVFVNETGGPFYIGELIVFKDNPNTTVDYRIESPLVIMSNGFLIIEAGCVIEFATPESCISVEEFGGLSAVGTAEKPIIFKGRTPEKGSWKGIIFHTENENNRLEFCEIYHAGSMPAQSMDNNVCAVGISNFANRANRASFKDLKISESKGYGIYVNGANSYFTGFARNTFTLLEGPPMGIPFRQTAFIDKASRYNVDTLPNKDYYIYCTNIGYNQGSDFIWDGTIQNIGTAYRMQGNYGPTIITGNCNVEAGVTFEFDEGGGLVVKDGSLKCIGSFSNPVTFKGTPGGPGKWMGICFQTSSANNALSGCIIDGAGYTKAPWSDGRGNIVLGSFWDPGSASIQGCQITNGWAWGIARKQTSGLAAQNNFFDLMTFTPDIYVYE